MARRIAAPNLQLPWSSSAQDNSRLKFWLLVLCIPFLIICVAIPFINIPEPDREELETLPPELAQIVLEKEKIPEPPKPEPEKEEPKKEEPKKDQPKEEKPPEPKPEPKPEPEPEPVPETVKLVEAKEAAAAEINQIQDDLLDLQADFAELNDIDSTDLSTGSGEAEQIDRAVIGAAATAKSNGVNTSNLSRSTGSTSVAGKKSTKVTSKIATATGKGDKATKQTVVKERAGRSDEEIRATIDKNKARIFTVYNRALRDNPALEGKVEFSIVIEPNGSVSSAKIISSELNDPQLESKILGRIRGIRFGVKDVLQTKVNYSIDFLPY